MKLNNEVYEIAKEIDGLCQQLSDSQDVIEELNNIYVTEEVNYERELAKTLMGLKNGKEYEVDGEVIKNPPASTTLQIAKGICADLKLKMDLSKSKYRANEKKIDILKTRLSGLQSIYKNLDEI